MTLPHPAVAPASCGGPARRDCADERLGARTPTLPIRRGRVPSLLPGIARVEHGASRRDGHSMTKTSAPVRAPRPQPYTVFGAAIVAGAAAAFGLNSALDTHLAQARPQVESESILVALRALPAGAPVTVWDVGLRDWPKAMVPSSAMRVTDDLDDLVVRHPLREGQPILAVQLGRVDAATESVARPLAVAAPPAPANREPERDLWDSAPTASIPPAQTPPAAPTLPTTPPVATTVTTVSTSFATHSSPPAPVTTEPATPAADPAPSAPPTAVVTNAPQAEPVTPTEAVITPPIAVATPQSAEDPRSLPAEASPAPIAVTVPPTAPEAPVAAAPPVADTAVAPPSPLRTAHRPRSAAIQALSVPNRSALSDEVAARADDGAPVRPSGRATAASGLTERSVTVRDGAGEAPRMLPGSGDVSAAPAAATAQASRTPQQRSATPRSAAAATRSARASGFTKGYRPN